MIILLCAPRKNNKGGEIPLLYESTPFLNYKGA